MFGFTGTDSVETFAKKRRYVAGAWARTPCPTRFDASSTIIKNAEKRVEQS
jgi:hypothetical protein